MLIEVQEELWGRVKREVASLYLLSSIVFIFSLYAMMASLLVAVVNILGFAGIAHFHTQTLTIDGTITFISVIVFIISTRLFHFSNDMMKYSRSLKGEEKHASHSDDDALTEITIKILGYYREKKRSILWAIWIMRVSSLAFLIMGSISTFNLYQLFAAGQSLDVEALDMVFLAVELVMAVVWLYLPDKVLRYSSLYEDRLRQSTEIEAELRKIIGGA